MAAEYVDIIHMNLGDPRLEAHDGRFVPPVPGEYTLEIVTTAHSITNARNVCLRVTYRVVRSAVLSMVDRRIVQLYMIAETEHARSRMLNLVLATQTPLGTNGEFSREALIGKQIDAEVVQRGFLTIDKMGNEVERMSAQVIRERPTEQAATAHRIESWRARRPPAASRRPIAGAPLTAAPLAVGNTVKFKYSDRELIGTIEKLHHNPNELAYSIRSSGEKYTVRASYVQLVHNTCVGAIPTELPTKPQPQLEPLTQPQPQIVDVISMGPFQEPTSSAANNQGRVRSDNVAALEEEGLLFRSRPEICFYRALKEFDVTFAPLSVWIRGDADHTDVVTRRIEPDFLIFKGRQLLLVEINGPLHQESPVAADVRTRPFRHAGAIVEHIDAEEVNTVEKARARIDRLLKGVFRP